MKPKIKTENGWLEVIIDDNCEYNKFYAVAEILENQFGLKFIHKLNDFDDIYWDFNYKNNLLTLHFNVYLGLSIFPRAFKEALKENNEAAFELVSKLYLQLS